MRSDHVTPDLVYEVKDYRTTEFEMFWICWTNTDACFYTDLIPPMRVIFNATGSVTFSDIITNPKRIM